MSESSLWQLIYEDLTHLGGPMGTEYTTESDWGFFTSVKAAKEKAEKYYSSRKGAIYHPEKIEWKQDSYYHNGKSCRETRSQDLGYVMFHIRKVKVEA